MYKHGANMKNNSTTLKHLRQICAVLAVSVISSNLWASGFQLFEGNGVNAANFSAGLAAGIHDASAAVYNPALLTDLKIPQVVFSVTMVTTKANFKGQSIWVAPGAPTTSPDCETAAYYCENGNRDGGTLNLVPSFHIAIPINNRLVAALSVTSPYGLSTDYGSSLFPVTSSVRKDVVPLTRYSATRTSLKTIDVSPTVAYSVTPQLSVGGGINLQYADVVFNSMAGLPLNPPNPTFFDSVSGNNGSSWGISYHLGAMYQVNEQLRLGLAYQARMRHKLHGSSYLVGRIAGLTKSPPGSSHILGDGGLNGEVTLPDSIIFGGLYHFTDRIDVMTSIVWTHWKLFKSIDLNNVATIAPIIPAPTPPAPSFEQDSITINAPQAFKNTWRAIVGFDYHAGDVLTLHAGFGFDQTPTVDKNRSVRLPDANRFAIACGFHYQHSKHLGLDLGYTHIFINKASINHVSMTGSQTVISRGRTDGAADLIGGQLTYDIDTDVIKLPKIFRKRS